MSTMSVVFNTLTQHGDVFSVCVLIVYLFVVPSYENFTDSIYEEIIFYTNQSTWRKILIK